jgi:hypothetical protein
MGNLIFSVMNTEEGLKKASAAFAGNQDIDIVDALATNSFINNLILIFNSILGILFLYFLVRLIISIIVLVKEQQNINKIIREEL